MLKKISIGLLGVFFIFAGWNHFRSHATYVAIMPSYLPWHNQLVDISGAAEMLGGIGVLITWSRKSAGVGLVLLLLAVFPANIQMAVHHVKRYPDPGQSPYGRSGCACHFRQY